MTDFGAFKHPILGNNLFRNVSLTIDWSTRTITIASLSSKQAPAHATGWDQVLDSVRSARGKPLEGRVALKGSIEGSPALFLLDTGQTIDPVCITDRRLAEQVARDKGQDAKNGIQVFDQLSWSVAGTHFSTPALTLPQGSDTMLGNGTIQGLIGTPCLLIFRVGIDYPGHKVYFHRFTSSERRKVGSEEERRMYFKGP